MLNEDHAHIFKLIKTEIIKGTGISKLNIWIIRIRVESLVVAYIQNFFKIYKR